MTVIGAGSMGHGIAQVSAMAGHDVRLNDVARIEDAVESIESNLDGGVERGKVTGAERAATLERIEPAPELSAALADADLVVEAVPEDAELKKGVFEDVEAAAPTEALSPRTPRRCR
jgi:3-hydroxybutyryl-CoA dehydrogenase